MFEAFGFPVSWVKLIFGKVADWVGFDLDLNKRAILLPVGKQESIIQSLIPLLATYGHVTLKQVSSMLASGLIVVYGPVLDVMIRRCVVKLAFLAPLAPQ